MWPIDMGQINTERDVAGHYTTGALTERIMTALAALGVDPAKLTPEDLKAADEFHTGGLGATTALLSQIDISPDMNVLDIGSGIGGTARHIAHTFGAKVHGIDLTQEYVDTATTLSAKVGMSDRTTFQQANATQMDVPPARYDLATLFHVGMNIADKRALFANVSKALKPGGIFALFEVMKTGTEDLVFPLPWSSVPDTSFVAAGQTYKDAASAAGMELVAERDRSAFSKDFFAKMAAKIAADGPPPLGIHLLMGDTAALKIKNYVSNLNSGRVAPTEMIFRTT